MLSTKKQVIGWSAAALIALLLLVSAMNPPKNDLIVAIVDETSLNPKTVPSTVSSYSPFEMPQKHMDDMFSGEMKRMAFESMDSTLIGEFHRCYKSYHGSPFGSGGDAKTIKLCADVEDRRPLVELVLDDLAWWRENSGQALDQRISDVQALPWQSDQNLRVRLIDALEKCLAWADLSPTEAMQGQNHMYCTMPLAEAKTLLESALTASSD